jgi:hypothetical protein
LLGQCEILRKRLGLLPVSWLQSKSVVYTSSPYSFPFFFKTWSWSTDFYVCLFFVFLLNIGFDLVFYVHILVCQSFSSYNSWWQTVQQIRLPEGCNSPL